MEGKKVRVVGFDTATEEHECVLLGIDGNEDRSLSCRNRCKSIEEAFAKLILRIAPDETLVVALEAPRAHGRLVFVVALQFGFTVWQVEAIALNHYRRCEGQARKDDHWDAFLAARMVFKGMKGCRVVADPRPDERVLSRLTRLRAQMVKQRVQLGHRLRAVMLELAPIVLDSQWKGPKLGSVAMRKILEKWPAFEGLDRARSTSIRSIFRSCRYGQAKTDRCVALVRSLPEEIVIPAEERAVIAFEIEMISKQLELLNQSISEIEKQLRVAVNQHPICCKLMEMPGIGLITASVLVGELLPVARNATEPSSATFSGVTPLTRKSGTSLDSAHLGRASNKRVLNALFLSAVKALGESALDRAYYDKKRIDYQGHPKPHTAATLALARQRHKVIFRLMTTEARYDKEVLIASHLKRQREMAAV